MDKVNQLLDFIMKKHRQYKFRKYIIKRTHLKPKKKGHFFFLGISLSIFLTVLIEYNIRINLLLKYPFRSLKNYIEQFSGNEISFFTLSFALLLISVLFILQNKFKATFIYFGTIYVSLFVYAELLNSIKNKAVTSLLVVWIFVLTCIILYLAYRILEFLYHWIIDSNNNENMLIAKITLIWTILFALISWIFKIS